MDSRSLAASASPRASIALILAARARAYLEGRGFATPHDVKSVAMDVLRHRVILSFDAESEGVDAGRIVEALVSVVPLP